MEFGVLGPIEVVVDGRRLELPAGKPRALVGLLLLHADRVVSVERIVDGLWGDRPPTTAPHVRARRFAEDMRATDAPSWRIIRAAEDPAKMQ